MFDLVDVLAAGCVGVIVGVIGRTWVQWYGEDRKRRSHLPASWKPQRR